MGFFTENRKLDWDLSKEMRKEIIRMFREFFSPDHEYKYKLTDAWEGRLLACSGAGKPILQHTEDRVSIVFEGTAFSYEGESVQANLTTYRDDMPICTTSFFMEEGKEHQFGDASFNLKPGTLI